jgi:hypothetical protein
MRYGCLNEIGSAYLCAGGDGLTDAERSNNVNQAKESKMGIALWIVGAIALMAAGAGVTFALASVIPQDVLQLAQANGRFAGLSAESHDEITGKPVKTAASSLARLRSQAG